MRWLLGTAATLAAVPGAALLVLIGTGAADPGPALIALAVVAVACLLLAAIWLRDMARLAEILRRAADGDTPAPAPRLPPVERIARTIERLARARAVRDAQIGQAQRAGAIIVERLPDPLLVLGEDRAVRQANEAARAAFGGDIAA